MLGKVRISIYFVFPSASAVHVLLLLLHCPVFYFRNASCITILVIQDASEIAHYRYDGLFYCLKYRCVELDRPTVPRSFCNAMACTGCSPVRRHVQLVTTFGYSYAFVTPCSCYCICLWTQCLAVSMLQGSTQWHQHGSICRLQVTNTDHTNHRCTMHTLFKTGTDELWYTRSRPHPRIHSST